MTILDDSLAALSGLLLDNLRRWGEAAEPWQLDDARAILDPDAPARWHFLTRPRGASKTTDLAALALILLVGQAPVGSSSLMVAADADQAALGIAAARGFLLRNASLEGLVRVEVRRIVVPHKQATVDVLAADAPSAWGQLPWLTIADELAQWPSTPNARSVWEAVVSAVPKRPDSRLVVISTAGSPAHWSHKVLRHARESSRWRVNEVPGPTPWIAPEDLEEQRRLLPESSFRRLHLNEWAEADDALVRDADLRACVVLDGPQEPRPGIAYQIGVDVGLRHDRTAIAVCHAEPAEGTQRRVVLDRLIVLRGSRGSEVQLAHVEDAIAEASAHYGRARVRIDPWQAIGLRQRLESRGVPIEEYPFTAQSVGRLANTLHLLLRDRLVALPDEVELIDELANVRLRETAPGVLRIDHDPGRHDDRAIALALAATALVEVGPTSPMRVYSGAHLRVDDTPVHGAVRRSLSGDVMDGPLPPVGGRW